MVLKLTERGRQANSQKARQNNTKCDDLADYSGQDRITCLKLVFSHAASTQQTQDAE